MTLEILNHLKELPEAKSSLIYDFERALQAPVMEMMLRGFRVDVAAREKAIYAAKGRMNSLYEIIQKFSNAMADCDLNPNSGPQLKKVLYEEFKIKPISVWKDGETKFPMDRKVLEKLEAQQWARPLVAVVLAWRDIAKQLQMLETEIDDDWRMRQTINITGTSTGRFSSSKSSTGSGGNMQNINPYLRYIFTADDGYDLYGYDLEQAESREMGLLMGILFDDWSYLDACENSDLHTVVSRLIWTNLDWNGDDKHDRPIAEQPYYRHMSYRDLSKRGGHGCLTEDHEVLTIDGWVPVSSMPEEILAWDRDKSVRVKVEHWTSKPYSGKFHEWENDLLSVKMTDDHRVYYIAPQDAVFYMEAGKQCYKLRPNCVVFVDNPGNVPVNALIPKCHITPNPYLSCLNDKTSRIITKETQQVYCPTVPSGAFYVRRKGKVSITGNSNYLLRPKTAAEHLKIPVHLAEEFQEKYYAAFPAIPKLHNWVAQQLQTKMHLTNVFGRRRDFFDRPDADETIRKAVAYLPQSATADRLNLGLYRIWKYMPEVELIAQVHDAVYFQAPQFLDQQEIDAKVRKCLEVPLFFNGRRFVVPSEGKVGFNWGNYDKNNPEKNPYGLKKLKF